MAGSEVLRAQQPKGAVAEVTCSSIPATTISVSATGATYRAVTDASTGSAFFATGQNADILVSGIDFNNTGGSQLFNHPAGIATNGTKIAITDAFNNRVLIWNTPPASNVAPDVVVGQANFTTNTPGTGRNQMNWPISVAIGGGKLFVTDTYNHRILIWNTIPTTNGTSADVVISASVLSTTLSTPWPWGVWSDGAKMVVGLATSSTAPVWTSVPTADNTPPTFTLTGTDGTANRFGTPRHVFSNGTMLLIGDHNATAPGKASGGTFVWTSFPTSATSPYSFFREDPVDRTGPSWMKGSFIDGALWAFGRAVFKWATPPTSDVTPPDITLTGLDWSGGDYGGVVAAGGKMYVPSGNLNRILGYNTIPTSSSATPDFSVGSSGVCTNTLDDNFFIQNGVPKSNGSNLFVASGFDKKLYVWRSLPDQSNPHPDLVYRLPFLPGAIALHNSNLVLGGGTSVYIWDALPLNSELPGRQFKDTIGGTALQQVRGVALDNTYFYVSDEGTDKIHVWNGLPQSSTAPAFSINFTDPQKIISDGTYLAVTSLYTHQVMIYAVSGLSATSVPVATLGGRGTFELPQDVYIGNGRMFVADTNFNRVLGWTTIASAISGATADIIIGETSLTEKTPEIGRDKVFWPGALSYDGRFLWLGEFKFSTRLLRYSPPCSYHQLSSTSQAFPVTAGTGTVTVTPNAATCAWTATSNASFLTVTSGSGATGTGTLTYSVAANTTGTTRTGVLTIGGRTFTVTQSGAPAVAIDRTSLNFAAVSSGAAFVTPSGTQAVRLTQSAGGSVTWTATSSQPWLTVSPASGAGSAVLTIGTRFVAGLAATSTGTVTITLAGAANTVGPINVTLRVVSSTAAASPPFGVFDTPVGDATVLAGSIAMTGWTLDNVGVKRVELWRDLQPGETTAPFASTPSDPRHGKVFIADAQLVDGARPDVEALYPTTPFNYRGGWGYLLLTWGLWNQGNGTYSLYAYAFDQEDNLATLGKKTIVVSNAAATKPFGSIDTPAIGGDPGTTPNFGWALTPKVAGMATCKIPLAGVQVSIDSGPLQPVVYGTARTDIAGAFPGFSNSAAAGGHFIVDWSTLKNGSHTIGWLVTDDCNRADGIGSRFFTVTTGTNLLAGQPDVTSASLAAESDSSEPITVARGFGELPEIVTPGEGGSRTISLGQGERIEVRLPSGFETAYQLVAGQRRALPAGATWDAASGTFYWQPAAGYLGRYRLVFSDGRQRISVRLVVVP